MNYSNNVFFAYETALFVVWKLLPDLVKFFTFSFVPIKFGFDVFNAVVNYYICWARTLVSLIVAKTRILLDITCCLCDSCILIWYVLLNFLRPLIHFSKWFILLFVGLWLLRMFEWQIGSLSTKALISWVSGGILGSVQGFSHVSEVILVLHLNWFWVRWPFLILLFILPHLVVLSIVYFCHFNWFLHGMLTINMF